MYFYIKKRIRTNIWKKREYFAAIKTFSLAKSGSIGKSKSPFVRQASLKNWSNLKFYGSNNSQSLKMFPLTNVLNSSIALRGACMWNQSFSAYWVLNILFFSF